MALADLVYDVVAASRLLKSGQHRLDSENDARVAAVAEWFVRERLHPPAGRGISEEAALSDATVDAVLRYARLSPDALES